MRPASLRPVRILSRYFVARYLGMFSMVLAVALLILATVELVLNLDDISSFGAAQANGSVGSESGYSPFSLQAAIQTGRYLGIRLTSYYLADLLPIVSFIAVFAVFSLAGRALERLATEAGGIPPVRIVAPVLVSAVFLSVGAAILHETVILRAEQVWSGERVDGPDQINFGREAFWLHKGSTITNVSHADPETRTLFGVEIFERGPAGAIIRVIHAEQVEISEDGRWHLNSARVWRFNPEDPSRNPEFEELNTVVFDLEALRGDQLLSADPALLPLPDLARVIKAESSLTPSVLRRLQNRYHERLSRPWLVLVFAWLALPFALRVDQRGGFAGPAAGAVAILGAYFLVESAARTLSLQGLVPVGLASWLTMMLFSTLASLALLWRAR